MARNIGWVFLIAGLLLLAAETQAQRTQDINRIAYELFQKGDYKGASVLLEQALRMAPSAKLRKNLVICYEKLRKDEELVRHARAYLEERPEAKDRAWAQRLIAAAEARIASKGSPATIATRPSGALVFLDRKQQPVGKTPLKLRLSLGLHVLRFEKEGFEPQEAEVMVRQRELVSVSVALVRVRRPTTISVSCDVPGARVRIDGRPARLGANPVEPGVHRIFVSREGYQGWNVDVHLQPEEQRSLVARLRLVSHLPWRPGALKYVTTGLSVAIALAAIMTFRRAGAIDQERLQFASLDGEREAAFKRGIDTYSATSVGLQITASLLAATSVSLFVLDWWRGRHASGNSSVGAGSAGLGFVPLPGGLLGSIGRRF